MWLAKNPFETVTRWRGPGPSGLRRVGMISALAGAVTAAIAAGPAPVRVPTADIASTFSQQAARTTTQTAPFAYELRHPDGLTILFNGARHGKIEPCGCRALNLGGIDKEAAMVQTIRRANPQTLYLDAGGYFRDNADPAMRLQTWSMLKALAALDCQAMNVGYPDLMQGIETLKFFQREFRLPLISANILDDATQKPLFEPYREFTVALHNGEHRKVAVVGITAPNRDVSHGTAQPRRPQAASEPEQNEVRPGRWMIAETNGYVPWLPFNVHREAGGAAPAPAAGGELPLPVRFAVEGQDALTSHAVGPYRVADGQMTAKDLGRELRKNHDILILLAYTSFDRAVAMAPELADYDLIVAADYRERMEPLRPAADGPLVVCGDQEGKYLGLVEIPRLDASDGRSPLLPENTTMLPVLQTIEPRPQFHAYIEEFARLTERLPVEESTGPASVGKIYAGSNSCRACHAAEFDQWKTHKHAHAMKTLVDRNMQFNPDCLKCHTVAYRQPGGFTDLRVTAYLGNVQCEVCHGPAQAHVQEMRTAQALTEQGKPAPAMQNELRMEWDQKFCMQCHDPKNDPHFTFPQDILRVRHKDPAPPRKRPTTMRLD